jgi:GLPGLI family protein
MKNEWLLVILFFSLKAFSQKQITGKVQYKSTLRQSLYIPGSSDRVNNLTVYFTDTSAAFVVNANYKKEDLIKQTNEQIKDPEIRSQVTAQYLPDLLTILNKPPLFYHKIGTNVFIHKWAQPNEESYCVVDSIAEYTWELLPDTTRILGFFCQKAKCKASIVDSKVRTFTAWYTPEIPIPFGPFKFYGLPGLILEVDDTYHNYRVKEIKLELPDNEKINLKCCSEKVTISTRKENEIKSKSIENVRNVQSLD